MADRLYEHYVFMLRNRDDDYAVPPTVVATTKSIEEAIDIMMDADQMVYRVEKAHILRSLKVAEMFIINEEVVVWKTVSRLPRLIIWSLRQHLNLSVADEFMSVWRAYRRYIDYVEHGMENDMELGAEEKRLLLTHAPHNRYLFRYIKAQEDMTQADDVELSIASLDEMYGHEDEYVDTHTFPIDSDDDEYTNFRRVYSQPSPDQVRSNEALMDQIDGHVCGKRSIATRRAMEEDADEELSHALKNVCFRMETVDNDL